MTTVLRGFKVITRRKDGTPVSMLAASWDPPEVLDREKYVAYREGEFVRPHKGCGPLAVFEDEKRAAGFLGYPRLPYGDGSVRELWEAEYVPYRGPRACQWVSRLDMNGHMSKSYNYLLPEGTKLATRVRLVRRIR